MSTAIFQFDGGIEAITAFMEKPLHIAWGTGDPAWDVAMLPINREEHALVAELGRRLVLGPQYCIEDGGGDIVVPNGRFSISAIPTSNLYVEATFDYADSPVNTIREAALYRRTAAISATPPGQEYLLPEEVEDPGRMIALTRFEPFIHTATNRMTIRMVVSM